MERVYMKRYGWRRLLALLLAMGVGAGCASPAPAGVPGASPATSTPELARDFTLTSLAGDPVSLSDYRGQWVLVNFWATWCIPCIEEMPYLERLATERELVVLGVNFKEGADTVAAFVAEHRLTFPILLAPDEVTLIVYGVRALPRTFMVAPDGTIAYQIAGAIDPETFDQWLDEHQIARTP
jgi:thiol-disulfide isomerase/thioredoxin